MRERIITPNSPVEKFWSIPAEQVLARLRTTAQGLTPAEAGWRLWGLAARRLDVRPRAGPVGLFLAQFKSPITLILICSAILAFAVADRGDAAIILLIVFVSAGLGFWQEWGASRAMRNLLALIRVTATVVREGNQAPVDVHEIVPGDIVLLAAGDSVPADCLVLESKDLFVNEALLTGETFPVEKSAGVVAADAGIAQRPNVLYLGTHVVSGTARVVAVRIGMDTEFGKISERLRFRKPETEFERGVRRFGNLLVEVTLLMVVGLFAINVVEGRPGLESFLFSLALAVGLTPQLLPAIISVNLAHGARRMAARDVIVRRLASIENFGSMDVLCSDKTGTLTEGVVEIQSACDLAGRDSPQVMYHAWVNAFFASGFANPIDEAIRRHGGPYGPEEFTKLDEVPYDFARKRLSILVGKGDSRLLITKGAIDNVLAVCSQALDAEGQAAGLAAVRGTIDDRHRELGSEGYRLLGVATREMGSAAAADKTDEREMTFLGFLVFRDPPRADAGRTVTELKSLGVSLKMITGDNHLVAAHIAGQVGLSADCVLTGGEIEHMTSEALARRSLECDVFAEIEPNQKERLVLALRRAGRVVGYLGDGINDASALHAADVGISVSTAADVAKEAADIVLLKTGLDVLSDGIREGRKTFANTLKYVFMATSANFGNMFSMAGASLFLPFLPLLPKQILLMNVLTDLPEMAIATDRVDDELTERPRRWDIGFILKFMLVFGVLSSIFDYVTFSVLLWALDAAESEFQTGWFVESVVSGALVVLVIRSRRSLFMSRPGGALAAMSLVVVAAVIALPYTPLAAPLGFVALPPFFLGAMALIVIAYVAAAELAKRAFYAAPAEAGAAVKIENRE